MKSISWKNMFLTMLFAIILSVTFQAVSFAGVAPLDLSIIKSDDIDPIVAGNTLTYTIVVNNSGQGEATNVVVTDTLPEEVTYVSTNGCTNDPNGVPTCNLGNILSGGSASFGVEVTVDVGTSGTITNQASVTSDTQDPVPGNDDVSEATVVLPTCDPDPLTQGYWHRQCLGVPASEGGLDPGRNGRGPKKPTEPSFVEELMPCTDIWLEDLGLFGETTCDGMDADPPSDPCERALKQLTALVLNVCSDRIFDYCEVDLSTIGGGCSSTNIGDLINELTGLIQGGQCELAADCSALVNEGEGLVFDGNSD